MNGHLHQLEDCKINEDDLHHKYLIKKLRDAYFEEIDKLIVIYTRTL